MTNHGRNDESGGDAKDRIPEDTRTTHRDAAGRDDLAEPVSVLAVGPLEPTPREHVAAVMARIRAEVDEEQDDPAVVLPFTPRRRGSSLLTHLVAAAIGAAIVWFLLDARTDRFAGQDSNVEVAGVGDGTGIGTGAGPHVRDGDSTDAEPASGPDADADSGSTTADATPRPAPERVLVFHPIEFRAVRPVRTIEVEVPVEVPIEVRVEVPVPGEREAVDRRLAASAGALASVFDRGARALESIATSTLAAEAHALEALEIARAATPAGRGENVDLSQPTAIATLPRPALTSTNDGSAVTIVRAEDRVRISTNGPLDAVVPALIAKLDDPDPSVRAAVERRLVDLSSSAGLGAPSANTAAASDDPWWRSDRGQAASVAHSGAGTDSADAWRAWWETVRGAAAF